MGYKVNSHASCRCNEVVSLHNRHLIDRNYIHTNKSYISSGFKRLNKLIKFHVEREPYINIVNKFSGAKKRAYYNAMINLVNNGYQRKHAHVKMFIKPDRWPEDVIAEKAPRAIQFRSKEYNLELAAYLKPFEETAYEQILWNGTRVVAKGLNQKQRAELWMRKVDAYTEPYFICLDHSKFDSTVNETHLKGLHAIYRKVCGRGVQRFLKEQYHNVCWTKTGIKYTTRATRCSGDYDTGLGNTLINIACILECFSGIKFDFMLDGDDAIIVTEKSNKNKINIKNFESFGFETKLAFTNKLSEVEFCQARLVKIIDGWVFVRNPLRAISNSSVIHKPYTYKQMAQYLAGVGEAELSVSAGVPIMQQQALRLRSSSDQPTYTEDDAWKISALGSEIKVKEIPIETRISFKEAWDIDESMQIVIEGELLPMMLSYILKRTKYDIEQLYESWARMATLGCTGGTGRWWFSKGGLPSLL